MPYSYLTFNENDLTNGIVSGSYFTEDLRKVYEQQISDNENYFGTSDSDIIEFTLYNSFQELISFNRIFPTVSYTLISGQYNDVNDQKTSYNFIRPFTNFAKFNNNLLIDTQNVLKQTNVSTGLYYLLYNFIRNVAGNQKNKLVIKEISPSRTELRLSFGFNTNSTTEAQLEKVKVSSFADKKYLFSQISNQINNIVDNNTVSQNFDDNSENFNYYEIANNLGLKSTFELKKFINDTYVGFDKIQTLTDSNDQLIQQSYKFVGIKEQLKNFTYTYNSIEFSKEEILLAFKTIVTKISQDRILQKTSINEEQLQNVLSLFVKIIYNDWLDPQISLLLNDYADKYFGLFKNALNFDNGTLIKILDHTSYTNPIDNTVNVQIKLDQPLPFEFDIRTFCWISNISISPLYFKVDLFTEPVSRKVYLNGVNFSVETKSSPPTNEPLSTYSSNDILSEKLKLKEKINDLLVDYSSFENFILYSSAELRTKIAKNKISEYNKKEDEKSLISLKIDSKTPKTISSSYSIEKNKIKNEQIQLLRTFDEYESYLFFNPNDIDQKITDSIEFDKNNLDSLINQLPSYIQEDNDYSDYLKFSAMVGHFFDNILIYIKKFPKTYPLGETENTDYPKNLLDELLNSFNWDSFNLNVQNRGVTQYFLNNTELESSFSSSYFDYGKRILNRFANNLPLIYKTKGTVKSIDLLNSLFGIPSEMISIKEYGNSDTNINRVNYYDSEEIVYLTKIDSDKYIKFDISNDEFKFTENNPFLITKEISTNNYQLTSSRNKTETFNGINTVEFCFRLVKNNFNENDKIPLIKKIRNDSIDWEIFLTKTRQTDCGILIFDFHPLESSITSSIKTEILPFFNGNVFNCMISRDILENVKFLESIITVNTSSVGTYVSGSNTYYNLTSSLTSSNGTKLIPNLYKLCINQYDGSLINFSDVKTKTINYIQNKYFTSGSYYVGNYNSDISFVGNIDKIKVFKNTVTKDEFNIHSYNLDSISIEDKENVYENLLYLWSFDTPVDLWSHTSSINYVIVPNSNVYYRDPNNLELNSFRAYNFKGESKLFGYPDCQTKIVSDFPYQFEKLLINQSTISNNYGPNFQNNSKINKIDEYAVAGFIPYDYSTKTDDIVGFDSNIVGFYISPYSYLNKKIKNFLGKDGVLSAIGDPKYLNSENYPDLNKCLKDFSSTNEKYIYPQEFYTTYKFYIDFSIFDYLNKIVPSRVSLKKGLLIEQSPLERKKITYKDISYNVTGINTSSIYFDNKAHLTYTFNTGSYVKVNTDFAKTYKTDSDFYNFSRLEISDVIDKRDFIYSKYKKYVDVGDYEFKIRNLNNIEYKDYYKINNSDGKVVTFTSSYNKVEIIGSGSLTGSSILTSYYNGIDSSGYSNRHLSKISMVGSRKAFVAMSGSQFALPSVSTRYKIPYYTYIKGKNDINTTINRQGIPNMSSPIISISGFLKLNLTSSNFLINGTLTGSINNPNSIFRPIPLTASLNNSGSLDKFIMNL